jgi:hypothetical protein
MNTHDHCTGAREWFSAHRDSEAEPDTAALQHIEGCRHCERWAQAFDHVTRQARLRAPMADAALTGSVIRIASTAPLVTRAMLGRVLLTVATVSGMVILLLGAVGLFGHSHLGSADGRQAEALTVSLLGGFALAAWRPARLAAGLLPVAVLAAAVTVSISIVEVASGAVPIVDELSHVSLLIGAVGAGCASRANQHAANPAPRPLPVRPIAQGV